MIDVKFICRSRIAKVGTLCLELEEINVHDDLISENFLEIVCIAV